MKMYLTSLVVAANLMFSQAATAQDENPAHEHLKQMEALIGTWERHSDTGQFVGRFRVTYDWVLRDRFIREIGQFQPEGESEFGEPYAARIYGWDQEAESLVVTSFMGFRGGIQSTRQVSRIGDSWRTGKFLHGIGGRPGGQTSTTSLTLEDKDTLVVETTGRTDRDGNARPDRTIRLTRVK